MSPTKKAYIPIGPDHLCQGALLADGSKRVERFRTKTIVADADGKKLVYKCPASSEARSFVREIIEKEQANALYVKDSLDVHCGQLEQDCIRYDYLPYPSLVDCMRTHMAQGRFRSAQDLLEQYVQKLHSLQREQVVPRDFLSLVGDQENLKLEADCLCRALLDFTPKNILVDEKRWVLLDNEWSFDFPVPIAFIAFRTIRELTIDLQAEICASIDMDHPAIGLFCRGLRTFYVPFVWVKYLATAHIGLQRFLSWEAGFWRYTSGPKRSYVGRINPKIPMRTQPISPSGKRLSFIAGDHLKRWARRFPGLTRFVHMYDR